MDQLTAIPQASKNIMSANPTATVAQQVVAQPSQTTAPAQTQTSTPTVVTDANIRESAIPDITTRTQSALSTRNGQGIVQGAAPDGSALSSNGNYIDKAGNQYSSAPASAGTGGVTTGASTAATAPAPKTSSTPSTATTTAAPENDYDAFLKSIFDSNPSTGTTGVAPANDPYLMTLATMRATSDAASKTLIDATMQQFASRKAQLAATQAASHAGLMQALISNGEARYAPILAGQSMTADETAGVLALSNIDAEQSSAVAQLQKAQADQNFQVMGKYLDHLDNLQTQKITVASKLADNAAAATKAINDAKAKVVDSVNEIAASVAKTPGVPASVIAAVASSASQADAMIAAGNWLQTSSDPTTNRYLMYARQADTAGKQKMTYDQWYAKDQSLQASQKYAEAYASEAGKNAADDMESNNVGAGTASTTAVDGSDIATTIASIAKHNKLSATTQAAISPILGVIDAAKTMADLNPNGSFGGINPANTIFDVKIPFTDIGLPGREAFRSNAGIQNLNYINGINLKVQQWASGASLTTQQTKQVEKMVPQPDDTDANVQQKLSNLVNFMQQQIKSTLATNGVVYTPTTVDLFAGSKGLDQLFDGVDSKTPIR